MWKSPAEVAAQLRRKDWNNLYSPVEDAVKERAVDWLVALLGELSADTADHVPFFRSMVIEGISMVPGAIRALVQNTPEAYFAVSRRCHADQGARRLAGRLGEHQPLDVLFDSLWLIDRPRWRTVFICWAQEMVLRGHDLREEPAVVAFWSRASHPLAALPLHRLPIEVLPSRYHHRYRVTGAGGWGSPPRLRPDTPRLLAGGPPPVSQEAATPAERERIGACYASARSVSNGKSEAAVFRLAAPVAGLSVGLLESLRLRCFNGLDDEGDDLGPVTAQQPVEAEPADARAVFATLLAEAANGGCYNQGWSGAWGRREAWRSLGGLAGADADDSLAAIAEAAGQCQWAFFRVRSEWFYGIMSDPAVACLRPDGQTVAIFAGTDTD